VFANVVKRLFKEVKLDLPMGLRREPNKASTNTKASARASRSTNTRGIDVEDGEGGKRSEGDHADLRQLENLAGDHVGNNSNCKTLK